MAVPAGFPESNVVLGRPRGVTREQCEALQVLRAQYGDGTPVVFSCWKLTPEELAEVNRTGRVWLAIYGQTMPPALIHGEKPF